MPDPYQTLGVAKTADQAAIKSAYRKLAKELHPDLNPGDTKTEKRFKEVSAAYDLLSDPKKRARFDRGEIDAEGNEQPTFRNGFGGGGFSPNFGRGFGRTGAGKAGGAKAGGRARGFKFGGGFGAEELFAELFGDENTRGGSARMRGTDYKVSVAVGFEDAVRGGKKRVNLPDGRAIDLTIPAGSEDGQTLRLRGQGQPGLGGATRGDALVKLSVAAHPFFTRKGSDVHVEVPVTLQEAILGSKILVPTIDGPVTVTVPRASNTGTKLRLKGKGAATGKKGARGDQFVRLKVVLPDRIDKELSEFMERWSLTHNYDVRKKAGME